MTKYLRAYLGTSGLLDVGYRLYNADSTPSGTRITVGVTELSPLPKWYGANVTIPNTFVGYIKWDSPSVLRPATEDIDLLNAPATSAALANVQAGTDTIQARIEAQAPGGGPVVVMPSIPSGFGNYEVIAVDFRDFGVTRDGVAIRAQVLGTPPFSTDGVSFETDGTQTASSGQAVTLGSTTYPATPGRAWLVLPRSATLRDRNGQTGLLYRFDSIGATVGRSEAISDRRLLLTVGGSLWQLLQGA